MIVRTLAAGPLVLFLLPLILRNEHGLASSLLIECEPLEWPGQDQDGDSLLSTPVDRAVDREQRIELHGRREARGGVRGHVYEDVRLAAVQRREWETTWRPEVREAA